MKILTQGRYATVASTAALVVALGGTSYAAVMITGHDIKNGTVTTKDVKNHNLELKDISTGAKKHLTGHPGAAGPQGASGPQGSQGPIGPSNAYQVYSVGDTTLTNAYKTLLSLPLAAGSYTAESTLSAQYYVANSTTLGTVNCQLIIGPNDIPSYSQAVLPNAGQTSITNLAAFTLTTGDTIHLDCYGSTGTNAEYQRLVATKVGSVSSSQAPVVNRAGVQHPDGHRP